MDRELEETQASRPRSSAYVLVGSSKLNHLLYSGRLREARVFTQRGGLRTAVQIKQSSDSGNIVRQKRYRRKEGVRFRIFRRGWVKA